eukprot:NODE_20649_length_788_cov_7.373676.p1 GENE.NODE_20649_length_788_cov_7.373676~~NODE_20649_length_788_cov_7.373676.p1  ORF type:complete len:169 (-),score=43.23 NODE_20649_length_788_cov_7.373676:280-723(-)
MREEEIIFGKKWLKELAPIFGGTGNPESDAEMLISHETFLNSWDNLKMRSYFQTVGLPADEPQIADILFVIDDSEEQHSISLKDLLYSLEMMCRPARQLDLLQLLRLLRSFKCDMHDVLYEMLDDDAMPSRSQRTACNDGASLECAQ